MSNRLLRLLSLVSWSFLLALWPAAPSAQGQGAPPPSFEQRYTAPIELFKTGLGTFTKPISTTNKEAQAFFDQGFQMMYAFAKPEAVRSFREAWKRDDNCAICYWGEAWAWGSYLNAPMSAAESPFAYAAAQKAALTSRSGDAEGARADRRAWPSATSRSSTRGPSRRSGSRLRRRHEEACPSSFPMTSRS